LAGEVTTERRQVAWIGQRVRIEGNIISDQDIRIDGKVHGSVEVGQHDVVLGAGSEVKADVNARSVLVGGQIEGDVTATDRIQIQSTGSLLGDVVSPRLTIQDGGMLRGKVDVAGARQNRSSTGPTATAAAPAAMGLARE